MKLYELLTEGKKQVDEAPMGTLSGLANKAMSKMGSSKAGGKVDTGTVANQLRKEFDTYLGRTGREATKDAVIGFLQSKGYPTQGAAQIINQTVKGQKAAPTGPLSAAEPEKVDPTGEPAAQTTPNFKQGNYKDPSYSMGTGFDKTTMKNTTAPLSKDAVGGVPKRKKVAVSAGKEVDSSRAIIEAGLPRSVIDKAILKAAQEAEIVKSKAPGAAKAKPAAAAPAAGQDTNGDGVVTAKDKQGFMAGVKKGLGKQSATKVDVNDLANRIAAIEKKVGLA
jgi:hypothetical protein